MQGKDSSTFHQNFGILHHLLRRSPMDYVAFIWGFFFFNIKKRKKEGPGIFK
jgi:hypothetical protein